MNEKDIPWATREKLLSPLRNPSTAIRFFLKNPVLTFRLFNKYYVRQPAITILHYFAWVAPAKFLRTFFHRSRGAKIGKHVHISPMVFMDDAYPELITIEDWVQIAAGTKIITHDGSFYVIFRDVPPKIAPVRIKRNAMIGTGAILLPGVTIGEKAIIGAGAVVTEDIPPRTIAVGVPAKPVCTIEEGKKKYMKAIAKPKKKFKRQG